ncbi:MAG TPA: HAMP domain-containing sensor histidine kinase [Acidimicrobiia bacterium]|nr:HAMP domain-containing sensor histidine kinase [Acidimicrobiia bacterium]
MPAAWRSIRFRLSVQYSAIVFGLGGALLGLVYMAMRRWLRSQTMTQYVWTGRPVFQDGRQIGVVPSIEAHEIRMIESVYNEIVLNEVARFTIFALIALFLLSLVTGWVMSGRVLKPVEEITDVAREIQASDLSRRIVLEGPDDEITRLASTFNGMLERLDRAFSSQRRFLADTSHDLRTPLAVIRSNIEVVADDHNAKVEDWQEVGGIVRRNVEKMSEMIDGLLATARLQTGKAQAVALNLATLVESKSAEVETLVSEQGIMLETRTAPALVEGVEVSLDRAFTNLLDNAIRVSSPGSTIRVGVGVVEGWAWMAVADQGPGMPAEPSGGRVGLGLSIVEQIAEAHDGALVAHEGPDGLGTTMVIWLPTPGTKTPRPKLAPFTDA